MQFEESNSTTRLRARKSFPVPLLPMPKLHAQSNHFQLPHLFLMVSNAIVPDHMLTVFPSVFYFKISIFDVIRWKTRI